VLAEFPPKFAKMVAFFSLVIDICFFFERPCLLFLF
jgi:hypothetical protein